MRGSAGALGVGQLMNLHMHASDVGLYGPIYTTSRDIIEYEDTIKQDIG